MATRNTEIHRAGNINSDVLRIPYAYIQEQFGYSVKSIQRQIHSEPVLDLGTFPNTFPQNVTEYYWIHAPTGANSWTVLGRMNNGLYFFYTAQCKNTPRAFLDKGGAMNLWVSWRYSELINFAMNQSTYDLYISETVVPTSQVLESEDKLQDK
jgi:hypothetical protein